MTLADLLSLGRRRWYIYAASVLAALVTIGVLQSVPRTHTFESEVMFAAPDVVASTQSYASYAETLINFTGAVDQVYNATYPSTRLSGPHATLFGNGVREGVTVGISAVGSQWHWGYDRPVLVIRVNAFNPEAALEQVRLAVGRIDATTRRLQEDRGVPGSHFIATMWDEQEVATGSFGATRTNLLKGAGAILTLALLFGTLIAAGLDRYMSGRIRSDAEARLGGDSNSIWLISSERIGQSTEVTS